MHSNEKQVDSKEMTIEQRLARLELQRKERSRTSKRGVSIIASIGALLVLLTGGFVFSGSQNCVEQATLCIFSANTPAKASVVNHNFDVTKKWISEAAPRGMVAPFDLDTCPDGWSEFTLARGRVVVGAGQGGIDDAGKEMEERVRGRKGGSEMVRLAKEQMPVHNHSGSISRSEPRIPGEYHPGAHNVHGPAFPPEKFIAYVWKTDHGQHSHVLSIGNTGRGDAHNNMPPFHVLLYCLKD